MRFTGFYLVLLGLDEFHRVLPGLGEHYWVVPSFTEFQRGSLAYL